MLVEFAGQSCSGKSTLIDRLERKLREQQFPVRKVSAWSTTRGEVLRALFDPRLLAWCLLNPHLMRGESARLVLGAIGRTRALQRKQSGLVLLDEGPIKLHKRRSLRCGRAHHLLQRALPAPDILVLVRCDPEVRLARLRREKREHADRRSDQELIADLSGEEIPRRFAATRAVPILVIDTTAPKDPLTSLWKLLQPVLAEGQGAVARAGLSIT
jgi:thymidylate kinase